MAYSEKLKSQSPASCHSLYAIGHTRLKDFVRAERIIRGGDFFDNIGGAHYNESILLGNELGFAKPDTQFFDYCPYRSRQINPR